MKAAARALAAVVRIFSAKHAELLEGTAGERIRELLQRSGAVGRVLLRSLG